MKISLTLFRYSLPDGTQQKQLEGGYIVREKILESVSLRKLRTHRLNVLSFLDRRADKWGANTYFASEFNHAGIVDMLSWNKQVFERLLRESVEDIKTKDKDNAKELAEFLTSKSRFDYRPAIAHFDETEALEIVKGIVAERALVVKDLVESLAPNEEIYPHLRGICTTLGRWCSQFPSLTTWREKMIALTSVYGGEDELGLFDSIVENSVLPIINEICGEI